MSSKEVKKSGATHGDAAPRDPADDASATLKIQNSTAALPLQSLSSSMTDLQSRHYSSRPLQSIEGRQWHTPPPSSSSWQHNDHGGGDGGSPRRHSSCELARDSSFDSQSLSPPSGCKRMIFSPVDSPSTGGQYQRSVVPAVNSREEEEEEEMRLSPAKKCKLRDVFEQCDEQFPVQQLRHPQHQQQRQQQLRRQTLGRGTGNIGNLRSLDSAQRNRIEQRDKTTMTTSAAVTATTTTANAATNTALKNTTVDNVKLVMADALTTSRKQQNSIIIQQHLNNHNSREHPFHNPQHNIQIRIRQNDESESAKGVNWNYDCDHTHDNTIILHDNNNYDHGNTTNYNNTALFNNSNNDNGDECTNPPHFWEGPYFYCLCTSLFLRCLHVICTPHVHPPCCHSQRRQRERQSPTSQHLDHHHFNTPEHHHSNETRRIHKLSIFTLHRRIPPHKRRILCRSLIITFMIITITFTLLDLLILHKYLNVWLASTLDWLHSHPIAGGVAFIGVFLVGSLSFFPVALLTLGAGYVYIDLYGLFFGILIAFFVCYSGYLLGAAVCFMRSRYLMRRLILKFSNRYPIVRAVDRAFGTMGFRLFLLLRLSPAMPFNALNYIGGITAIKFKDYWWATSVGVVPGLIWTIFVGATFGTVDQRGVDGNKEFDENAVRKGVVLGLGIGLGVLGLVGTGIYARRELTKIVMAEQMEILREEEEEEQHLQQRLQSMENGGVVSISVGDSGVDDDDPSTGKVSLTTSSQNSMVMEDLENSNRSFAEVQEGDDYYDEHHHEELMDSFDDEGVWNYQSEASGVSLGREHFMTPRETISSPSSGSPTENATTIRNTPIRPRPWTPELVVSELPILPNIFRRLSGVPSVDLDFNNGNVNHTTPLRMAFSEGISRTESTGGLPSTTMATNTTPFRFQSPPPNRRRANSDTVAFTSDPTTRVSASPFSLGVGLNLTPLKNYDEMIGLANIDEQTVLSFARQHGDFDNKMQTPSSTGKNRVNRKRSNTDPTVAIAKVDDVEKMEKSNLMTLPKSTSSTSTSSSSLWTPIKTFGMKKRHSATSLNELKKDSENGNDDSLPRSLSSSERLPPPTNILADGSSDSNDGSKSKNIITTPTPKRQTRSRPTTPTPSQEANFTRHNRRHTVQLSPSGNHLEVSLGNGDDDVDAQQGREDREWFWIWA